MGIDLIQQTTLKKKKSIEMYIELEVYIKLEVLIDQKKEKKKYLILCLFFQYKILYANPPALGAWGK